MSFSSLNQGNLYNTFDFRNKFQNNYSSNDIYLEDSYTSTEGFTLREGVENAEGTVGGESSETPQTEVSNTLKPYIDTNEKSEEELISDFELKQKVFLGFYKKEDGTEQLCNNTEPVDNCLIKTYDNTKTCDTYGKCAKNPLIGALNTNGGISPFAEYLGKKIKDSNGDVIGYMTNYGYFKPLDEDKMDTESCSKPDFKDLDNGDSVNNGKLILSDGAESFKYKAPENSAHPIHTMCIDGDINLNWEDNNGNKKNAYYSPSGKVYKYGDTTWVKLNNDRSYCTNKNDREINIDTSKTLSIDDSGGATTEGITGHALDDSTGDSSAAKDNTNFENELVCTPYYDENDFTGNNLNWKNNRNAYFAARSKLNARINDQKKNLNKFVEVENVLEEAKQNTAKSVNNVNSINLVNNYDTKYKELQELKQKYLSKKEGNSLDIYSQIKSLETQKLLWMGSALALGFIVVNQIKNI